MSDAGNLFVRLGQVLLDRESWGDAAVALSAGIAKGELHDAGSANLMLGIAFYHQSQSDEARKYFAEARSGDTSRESAAKWLQLLDKDGESS
jgi:uncharacterized protein HemY